MYEFQLTNRINIAVQEVCRQFRLKRVSRILLKVGALRNVNAELVTFIFASLSRGTPAEGALMSVMYIPATYRCKTCSRTWTTEEWEFVCPYCSGHDVGLVTGFETAVDFMEVESDFLGGFF